MKKVWFRLFFGVFLVTATSCSLSEDTQGIYIFSYGFDFSESDHGWQHGFSDYPASQDSSASELKYAYTNQPGGEKALMLSGNNHRDKLFMFVKKKLTDLKPETQYTITFDVQLSTSSKVGSNLTGNVDGESISLKVGALDKEPKKVIERGNVVMNIDKGDLTEDGADMIYIGNVLAPESESEYSLIARTNSTSKESPLLVQTNGDGELWLIVGTESGAAGVTTLFYNRINIALSIQNK
jgi:hypothetical protein